MIRFVQTRGHRYTLGEIQQDRRAPRIEMLTYDRLIGSRRLRRATYVFTDFDRMSATELELAGKLYLAMRKAGLSVLNNPARVKTRYTLLRALHAAGLNDFRVHPASELPPDLRFPVYVRKWRGHANRCSELLESRAEIDAELDREVDSGVPIEHLIVVEYAGEPIRPDLYRKLATFRIGSAMTPYLCGHDDHWHVKIGKKGIAGEDLYEEEYRLIRESPFAETVRRAFELAEIEYGRADFGFWRGRLQIFEINTNPQIPAPAAHPSPARRKSIDLVWRQILEALHTMDSPPGPDVWLAEDDEFRAHRGWYSFLYRTRPAP